MADKLGGVVDTVKGGVKKVGGGAKKVGGKLKSLVGLSEGGVMSGPMSGYPAMLHGTEAVVPLSGGRSIPVEMKGGGGGNTFNITVNAGGITDRSDKRAMAREIGNMIQQEVARSIGGATHRGRF